MLWRLRSQRVLIIIITLNSRIGSSANPSSIDFSFLTGLIPRTLGPSNDFTLLNGWICLHGVKLSRLLVGFRTHFKSLNFHSFHSFYWRKFLQQLLEHFLHFTEFLPYCFQVSTWTGINPCILSKFHFLCDALNCNLFFLILLYITGNWNKSNFSAQMFC